ncbi:aldehyde dehydrogenase-like isoform X1 [Aphis craccivora]|uniref:Aldehyde dehydrogenase-like isoform X1 n=1 Tax=Aphis craccivora TaxID=307492 RepID=A0A6G0Z3H2_APHCR|nr:aldehyde dehydrogenase-like isoform X1 [Aphis craccivora]
MINGPYFTFIKCQPVGVVGSIIPWNYPTVIAVRKLAPALAIGCTVVLKPTEQTPFTALYLTALLKEINCPHANAFIVRHSKFGCNFRLPYRQSKQMPSDWSSKNS